MSKTIIFCSKGGIKKFRRLRRASFRPLRNGANRPWKGFKKIQLAVYFHLVKFQLQTTCFDISLASIKLRPENHTIPTFSEKRAMRTRRMKNKKATAPEEVQNTPSIFICPHGCAERVVAALGRWDILQNKRRTLRGVPAGTSARKVFCLGPKLVMFGFLTFFAEIGSWPMVF